MGHSHPAIETESFSFTVVSVLPPTPTCSADPILVPEGATSTCIPAFKTQQDFLDLFDRIVPPEYIEPLKSPGPGYEILQMFAKVFERISIGVGRSECQMHLAFSSGGAKAKGDVEFFRTSSSNGAFTLKSGSVVRASNTNREYVLLTDVVFGATDLKKVTEVEARQPDFQFNVTGITVDANGNELEGEIDELILPLMDASFAEPTLQVRQVNDLEGGQPASLDQIGADRSIDRAGVSETDDAYRFRVRQLPDTVSPDAIQRQLDDFFRISGITHDFLEVFENRLQSCWNAPSTPVSNPIVGDYDPNLFVYNDPRTIIGNRWMGADTIAGGFVVEVPNITLDDHGFAFDAADISTVTGIPAFDVTLADAGAYNGEDLEASAFLLRLSNLLRKIKAGGVASIIELEGQ